MRNRLLICGSPDPTGRTVRLVEALARVYEGEPETMVTVFSVLDRDVGGCTACECCEFTYRCVIDDDMQDLYPLLDTADDLTIVTPVFFAGPPSQMKAVLDRMQPYFWKSLKEGGRVKRPAQLYILGEGGDPHGFEPLVISTRSAIANAGFWIESIYDCVGLDGEELDAAAIDPEPHLYLSPSAKPGSREAMRTNAPSGKHA